MARFLMLLGQRLVISKRNRSVRQSLIFLITNALLLAAIIFTIEIVLILLGVGDVFLPITRHALDFMTGLVL